jgi:CDP-diacylglycerol---serine O-phosphatidyltransferase
VTPALVLYLWGLRPETSLGWIAVLVYAVCCMLRLARFNVGIKGAVGDSERRKDRFIGVPSPAGAMLVLAPMYLVFMLDRSFTLPPVLIVAFWMVAIGALMISRIRTPSLKADHGRCRLCPLCAGGRGGLVAAMLTYPWVTLSLAITVPAGDLLGCGGERLAPPGPQARTLRAGRGRPEGLRAKGMPRLASRPENQGRRSR